MSSVVVPEPGPQSITRFLDALHAENTAVRDEAASEIWARYMPRLLAIARRHLDDRVRRREDEHDVVQSMYKSFFVRHQRGDLQPQDRDDLWHLLVTITVRKSVDAARRHVSRKRDVRQETGADRNDDESEFMSRFSAKQPTPLEAAMLAEVVNDRLAVLDEQLQKIALWKLEGHTNQAIADRLGCAKRTVIRKLELIREHWADVAESNE